MEQFDVCIIGGGPAGLTAALYAARSGLSAAVFEKQFPGGQMATAGSVENYPGFQSISGPELSERMLMGAQESGAVIIYSEVLRAELGSSPKVIYTRERRFAALSVIIATGAFPRKLGVPGEEALAGHGVSYCAECDGPLFRNKSVVVAGGGNTAAANALYLAGICRQVSLVHRRGSLRASSVLAEALENSGVRLILNHRVAGILGTDTVTGVRLESVSGGAASELECSGVFVAVGRIPESGIFKGQLTIDSSGYIAAGEDTASSLPGVFAAGDVRQKDMRQIVTAAADGAASSAMAEKYLKMLT